MKIGVLIKTVNLVYAQTGMELEKNFVGDDDIIHFINPLDEVALEYALQLKDKEPGTQVVAISCGDSHAEDGLRRCLAMGADRAMLIESNRWEELDGAAASKIVGAACDKETFDLILCGSKAIDDNDGILGPFIAERLDMPYISSIVDIEVDVEAKKLKLQRLVEGSDRQLLESSLSVLITVEKGSIIPRYPNLRGFLAAENAEIEKVLAKKLVATDTSFSDMNLTEVTSYSRPRPKKKRTSSEPEEIRPAEERISYMIFGDASMEKGGGSTVEAGSDEMYERFGELLKTANVFSGQ